MPVLTISTNLCKSDIPSDFCLKMSKVLAETLSKPESFCVVHVQPDQMLLWGGTKEPAAMITCLSIGKLGVEENKKHSKAIMSELNKLGVVSTRMFINFIDPKGADVGYNDSTFDGIM